MIEYYTWGTYFIVYTQHYDFSGTSTACNTRYILVN